MTRTTKLVITLSIFAVAARLILIDQPYVDHWSWRQSDVAAIARNFQQNGFRFAYPQIDWAGDAPGYVGTEFPILPFVAAICYRFAGVHEWIGRAQAVVFFAASLPFFFLFVREIFGETAARWATFFYSFAPLNIFAGRSFMPDVPSLSLALIGLYFFLRWIDNEKPTLYLAAAITTSLSLLIKLPSVVIAAPILFLAWQKWRWNFLRQAPLWLFAAVTIFPAVAWYWHAHQIAERFYPHHFFGAGGIQIENFSWYWNILNRTAASSLTPILSALAIIGLFVTPRGKYTRVFHSWLAAMILFIIVAGYGNRHQWYQLPMVPITAALAGTAFAFMQSKLVASHSAMVALFLVVASSFAIFACFSVRPLYESSAAQLRDAGLELRKSTAGDSLIVAADTGDPTIFYYAERHGWHFLEKDAIYDGNPRDSQQLIVDLESLRTRGATHLVFTTNTFWWLDYYPGFAQHVSVSATLMTATPQFKIYKLTSAIE
jgi:4-amino-4-deoxy-L-arabinose transferase-like glycosyltransferase